MKNDYAQAEHAARTILTAIKHRLEDENAELRQLLKAMLDQWDEQFGEDACDCPHEKYNRDIVCTNCMVRLVLGLKEPDHD